MVVCVIRMYFAYLIHVLKACHMDFPNKCLLVDFNSGNLKLCPLKLRQVPFMGTNYTDENHGKETTNAQFCEILFPDNISA